MDSKLWTTKLQTLDKRLKAFIHGYRQNIAILGNDNEEISYLLENYFLHNKSQDVVYIHITTIYTGKKDFFRAVVFALLSNYTHTENTLDTLINCASPTLNLTTDFIKVCLRKEDITFLDIIEAINKFINESKKRCVFVIEEFLGLSDLFKDFYPVFSKFIILQRKCMIILTSLHCKHAQKILSGELNLLFGNFEKVYLDETSSLDNYLSLKRLLTPISPSPLFLSFFVNIIGSNQVYYESMANSIKDNYLPNDEERTIQTVIEATLYSKRTYFFQKFIKNIDLLKVAFKDFIPAIKLLLALSEGYLRKKELASLNICDSKELAPKLQKILDLNYIENLGNIYKIKDPLFSFWLSHVFKLNFCPPLLDIKQQRHLYKRMIKEEIDVFKEEFLKDKLKRVLQLFSSFKNDTLCMGKNKYRLPTIEKTKIISYPDNGFHLLVGEGKEMVFAGIKEKDVNDNDIFEFIEKGSNIKGKKVRKIFISLDTLSPTARLIAKNNKLTIWDVNEVNRLLTVYNKPIVSFDAPIYQSKQIAISET